MTRSPVSPFAATLTTLAVAAALCAASAKQTVVSASQAISYTETIGGTTVRFEMVPVPGGNGIEPFYLGRTEVTWDLYDVFALGLDAPTPTGDAHAIARPSRPYGAPDYGWGHAGYPAISIAREAAEAFTVWLSKKTGKAYRLPTEAEWEHAAEMATRDWPVGGVEGGAALDRVAWHRENANRKTHPVGTREPDALGLFDLFGNAAEWVATPDGTRVTRGGSFRTPLADLGPDTRAEQDEYWNERDPQLPKSRWWLSDGPHVGLRVAR